MIKGTTPVLHFNIPISTSLIASSEIVMRYVDNNKTVIVERTMEESIVDDFSISAILTQEETLALPAPAIAEVQLRIKTHDNTVMATPIYKISVKELLKESVIE